MSLDRGRHAATSIDGPAPSSNRRAFLTALDEVVRSRPGLACGIVTRRGVPILNVVRFGAAGRSVEIGCDFSDGCWWFAWAADGQTIAPVDDPDGAADVIAHELESASQP